jgi:hypothetical protein
VCVDFETIRKKNEMVLKILILPCGFFKNQEKYEYLHAIKYTLNYFMLKKTISETIIYNEIYEFGTLSFSNKKISDDHNGTF